jgi:glycosyltransferase involved in cell wall biosynthesis
MTTDPEVKDSFLFLHDASDEELSWLYDHSLFSVYPSFYEGWGLPIAESIAHQVPCACSNTSSMPEVAGDFVTYFSPASTDECLAAITHLLDNNTRKKAKTRLSDYQPSGWNQTFKQLTEIIGVKHD